ncbi:hypothetical protein ACFS2C_19235 [Prauserella oleivorans]|uniref:Uncharacterized protein n=1 Tax=Prauserella oleivorans TaxID=1478153 RepID=A0ABW5WCQ3_9PSEU
MPGTARVPESPDAAEPRREGPSLVWAGPADGPTVVVLDPAGEAKHGELPPTWADLVARRRVCWVRLPVEGALTEAEELLSDPSGLGTPLDIVVSGPLAFEGLDMATRHPDVVRSVLVVDPEPGEHVDRRLRDLAEAGVTATVVARRAASERDRIPPPLPLGHPDVTAAVAGAVADLDRGVTGRGPG